jgi:hypothetical protein
MGIPFSIENTRHGTELTQKQLDDLTKTTGFSPQVIQRHFDSFLFDCPNGKLTK